MKRVFLLGIVLAGLLGGTAQALDRSHPYTNPLIPSLDAVAIEYWGARGIALPPLEVFLATEEEAQEAGAEGELGASGVWLTPWAIRELLDDQPWEVHAVFCVMWLHERGHNAGLTHHVPWYVMHERAYFHPPSRCNTWARSVSASR